jgi:glucosamine--fructose-6-phosphate aminotransferase (isomerizing)
MALAGVTDQIVYLEEGDVADLQLGKYWLVDRTVQSPERRRSARCARCKHTVVRPSSGRTGTTCRKEIFEQPRAIADTLEGISKHHARAV